MTETDNLTTGSAAETHSFQAEVAELLHLMVHSVYSETDIFLRELISNASDACDRLRYEAIAQPELAADDHQYAIRITPDADANTLTIADNGIGMERQDLIDNLGTIARSGTRAFLENLPELFAIQNISDIDGCVPLGLQISYVLTLDFRVVEIIEIIQQIHFSR